MVSRSHSDRSSVRRYPDAELARPIRYADEVARLQDAETELRRPVSPLLPVGMVIDEPTIQPEDSLEYDVGPAVRQRVEIERARPAPQRRRGWGRLVVLVVGVAVIGGGVFVAMGGAGAVMVAGGAAAGWLLYTTPVIDVELPAQPAANPIEVFGNLPAPAQQAPAAAPAQGSADANLVVMPDPGFRPADPKPKKKLADRLP